MSKFFKISGIAVLIGCAVLLIAVLPNTIDLLFVIIVIAFIAISGLLLIAVGDLMDRVDFLENALELHDTQTEQEDKIMQIACPQRKIRYGLPQMSLLQKQFIGDKKMI